jgi:hypothetical protein
MLKLMLALAPNLQPTLVLPLPRPVKPVQTLSIGGVRFSIRVSCGGSEQ